MVFGKRAYGNAKWVVIIAIIFGAGFVIGNCMASIDALGSICGMLPV